MLGGALEEGSAARHKVRLQPGLDGREARSGDASSSSISTTRATRSMSASWASSVAPRRQATAAIMQSSIPRGVTPTCMGSARPLCNFV